MILIILSVVDLRGLGTLKAKTDANRAHKTSRKKGQGSAPNPTPPSYAPESCMLALTFLRRNFDV